MEKITQFIENLNWVTVTIGVPAVVLVVALFVIVYALQQKATGKLRENDVHEGIIQRLYENGESTKTVMDLARTRKS